jgi:Cysteine-rich CPCC
MIEQLDDNKNIKYTCVCCGYKTMYRQDHLWDICPVCFWQSDPVQNTDYDYKGGANRVSLREAQQNFIAFGACEESSKPFVRGPNNDEPKVENFNLIDEQQL